MTDGLRGFQPGNKLGKKYKPGESGNTGASANRGGRQRRDAEVVRLGEAASPEAMRKLIAIMRGKNLPLARMAANDILDRTYGRPKMQVAVEDRVAAPEQMSEAELIALIMADRASPPDDSPKH